MLLGTKRKGEGEGCGECNFWVNGKRNEAFTFLEIKGRGRVKKSFKVGSSRTISQETRGRPFPTPLIDPLLSHGIDVLPARLFCILIGCKLLFSDETADQRLKFFPTNAVREKDVTVPPNQRCTFYYGNQFFVQYLDCTGSWRPLTAPNLLDTVELTPGWSNNSLKIRVSLSIYVK